jgi:hypothetical protein
MIREFIGGTLAETSIEDVEDDGSMSFEQAAAAFSGDPLTQRRFELTRDVKRLENLQAAHIDARAHAYQKKTSAQKAIVHYQGEIEKIGEWRQKHSDVDAGTHVPITLEGKTYNESSDFVAAIEPMMKAATEKQEAFYKDPNTLTKRATSYEIVFPVAKMTVGSVEVELFSVSRPGSKGDMREPAHFAYKFSAPWGNSADSGRVASDAINTPRGLVASMQSALSKGEELAKFYGNNIDAFRREISAYDDIIAKPFEQDKELRSMRAELKAVVNAIEETQNRFTFNKEEMQKFEKQLNEVIGSDWTQKITLFEVQQFVNSAPIPTKMLAWFDRQAIMNEDAFNWVEQELERQREEASKSAKVVVEQEPQPKETPLPRRDGITKDRRPNVFTGEGGAMQQRAEEDDAPTFQAPDEGNVADSGNDGILSGDVSLKPM